MAPWMITSALNTTPRDRGLACAATMCIHAIIFIMTVCAPGNRGAETGHGGTSSDKGLMVTYITLPPTPPSEQPTATNEPAPVNPAAENITKPSPVVESETQSSTNELSARIPTDELRNRSTAHQGATDEAADEAGKSQNDLLVSYHAALRQAIQRKWAALSDRRFPAGSGCTLRLNQDVGGVISETSAIDCAVSDEDRLQLEAAVLMAQPLPYSGYESVFASDLKLSL